jgi:hypothetical protein
MPIFGRCCRRVALNLWHAVDSVGVIFDDLRSFRNGLVDSSQGGKMKIVLDEVSAATMEVVLFCLFSYWKVKREGQRGADLFSYPLFF